MCEGHQCLNIDVFVVLMKYGGEISVIECRVPGPSVQPEEALDRLVEIAGSCAVYPDKSSVLLFVFLRCLLLFEGRQTRSVHDMAHRYENHN